MCEQGIRRLGFYLAKYLNAFGLGSKPVRRFNAKSTFLRLSRQSFSAQERG
jgi:hypothetical protein